MPGVNGFLFYLWCHLCNLCELSYIRLYVQHNVLIMSISCLLLKSKESLWKNPSSKCYIPSYSIMCLIPPNSNLKSYLLLNKTECFHSVS